jgi:hypothetical protein
MSQTEKKFSFAKAGGPAAQPVEEIKSATPVAPEGSTPDSPQNLPAKQDYTPPAFYTGEEDEPSDPSDVRLPRLNIVQKSSQSNWLDKGVFSLLLKGEVLIAKKDKPFRFVAIGARPKIWIEKTKYQPNGGGEKAQIARSIDEVVQKGGTDQWRFSKENPKANSTKPWFMPSVTLAVLVEKPADCPPDQEAHFAYVVGDKAYAAALLSVKSTNYEAVWVFISSERRGVLSKGFNSRFIDAQINEKTFSGGSSGVFKLSFGPETSAELRELADKIVKGE